MGLTARERQSLNSIENSLAGSDPGLAAFLSMFTRLALGEGMPDREKVPAGPPWALQRVRRARSRSSLHRACRHMGSRHALLWLSVLTTAGLIVALALSTGGSHGSTCTGPVPVMACTGPASGHSAGPSPRSAPVSQPPQRRAAGIPQDGP